MRLSNSSTQQQPTFARIAKWQLKPDIEFDAAVAEIKKRRSGKILSNQFFHTQSLGRKRYPIVNAPVIFLPDKDNHEIWVITKEEGFQLLKALWSNKQIGQVFQSFPLRELTPKTRRLLPRKLRALWNETNDKIQKGNEGVNKTIKDFIKTKLGNRIEIAYAEKQLNNRPHNLVSLVNKITLYKQK